MGYQGYQGYGPKADIAQLLIQQQAAQANGMKGGPMPAGANLGAIPDIGSAEQQAGSSRKIADLLMGRAMSRNQQGDVVNWGTGLGQLGEALLARNANKKADSADAKYAEIKSALMKQAGQGNMDALFQLDPAAAMAQKNADRTFGYTKEQDVLANTRADRGLDLQGRGVNLQEEGLNQNAEQFGVTTGMDQDQFGQTMEYNYAKLEADKAEADARAQGAGGEYGLAPIYGRDKDGNRVLIQANKAGGVRQADLPEGVTLEDDRFKSSQRALGTAEGKKAAYQTEAGQAVVAVQDKADFIMSQIDRAIEQSDGWNTGMSSRLVWSPDFNATLDSIGANAMLSELLNVKKQGGTLGALSEGEGKALRDAAVNVTKSQSEKQLDANLAVYRMQIQRSVDLLKQAYEADYQSGMYEGSPSQAAPPAASGQDVEIDELLKKYGAQ
jgi:hypothetical protein